MADDIYNELTDLKMLVHALQADVEYYKRLARIQAEKAEEYKWQSERIREQLHDVLQGYVEKPAPIIVEFSKLPEESKKSIQSFLSDHNINMFDGDNCE